MKLLLIIISILLSSIIANSQNKGVFDGYVVLLNNDTVYGKVKVKKVELMHKWVLFNKTKYKPNAISAYGYGNYHYRLKNVDEPFQAAGKKFLKIEIDDIISLYQLTYMHLRQSAFSPNMVSTRTIVLYVEKEEQLIRINKLNFEHTMAELFKDYPDIVVDIKTEEYGFGDLRTILYEINNRLKKQ